MDPSKVLVLSGYTENIASFADLARKNHEDYCARHGYAYQCPTAGFHRYRAPSWSKMLFILKALADKDTGASFSPRWDWVFWMDIDAIFTNPAHTLEAFISGLAPTQDMLLGEDIWGINTGLWFTKNTQWSYNCLVSVWHSDPLPFLESGLEPPVWIDQARYMAEQTTLWHWLALNRQMAKVKLLPYYELGGYLAEFDTDDKTPRDQAFNPPTAASPIPRKSWKEGDFCLHLAGVPNEERVRIFTKFLQPDRR
jgi:galactosyl transferase GMA12/MNN10 family